MQAKTEQKIELLTEWVKNQTPRGNRPPLMEDLNSQMQGELGGGQRTTIDGDKDARRIEMEAPIRDSASLEPAIEDQFQTIGQEIEATVPISVEKHGTEIVEVFSKLGQEDDLEDYDQQFEQLRLGMLFYNPYLPESYFISCYIAGLKLAIKSLVKLGRPKELAEAMELARLHNKSIQEIDFLPADEDELQRSKEFVDTSNQEIKAPWDSAVDSMEGGDEPLSYDIAKRAQQPSKPENGDLKDLQIVDDDSEVILKCYNIRKRGGAFKELAELVSLLIELMEMRLARIRKINRVGVQLKSIEALEIWDAHQVFVEMHNRDVGLFIRIDYKNLCRGIEFVRMEVTDIESLWETDAVLVEQNVLDRNFNALLHDDAAFMQCLITVPYDRGKWVFVSRYGHISIICWARIWKIKIFSCHRKALIMSGGVFVDERIRVFDPGGNHKLLLS